MQFANLILTGLCLLVGTISTITTKTLYQTSATGLPECGERGFIKPYFSALSMFIGESLCLIIYNLKKCRENRDGINQSMSYPILSEESEKVRPPLYYFAFFCCFDMTATILSGIGLTWVDASLYQMLRGAQVVFAALVSMKVLRKQFTLKQWLALLCVVVGLALVGVSGYFKAENAAPDPNHVKPKAAEVFLGIGLILFSAILWGTQSVLEEKYMKSSPHYTVEPLELVGWEGFFGALICGLLVLPAAQHIGGSDCGQAENTLDTLSVLGNNPTVLAIVIGYTLNLTLFNFLSNQISKVLSAVHRQLVNAARTVSVWTVGLVLYYYVNKSYGEELSLWSLLEVAGFIFVVTGTIIYGVSSSKPVLPSEEDVL